MIKRLFIQNLILLEQADIYFDQGLQIITGETGAGKSALLTAVKLLLGAKSDQQLIRQDAPSAVVEAELELTGSLDWLEEEGVEAPTRSVISLRREIHRSGKNRCFLEEQQISLAVLKKIVSQMVELVDQNSAASLCLADSQRKWLDAFAQISSKVSIFSQAFKKEKTLEESLKKWLEEDGKADFEKREVEEELALIEKVNIQENEEIRLGLEHTILSNAQELMKAANATISLLSENQDPLISLLQRTVHSLEQMTRFDPRLVEPASMIKRAALELEDAVFFLRSYMTELDADPEKLLAIEERLALIEKLKKRFGAIQELPTLKETLIQRLDHLSQLSSHITSARKELEALRALNEKEATEISVLRKDAALHFSLLITKELHSLNLPNARFEVELHAKPTCSHGADEITFLFSANPGHPPLPLQECASGGELSRVFLAIKIHLAERDQSTSLIFDEIDSNVGGQTATILGEKLQALSQKRQVICVTHFVQMAKCAAHHFLVSKKEALTSVKKLSLLEQEEEFNRMLGKKG